VADWQSALSSNPEILYFEGEALVKERKKNILKALEKEKEEAKEKKKEKKEKEKEKEDGS
jgi:hypothetical protein